MQAYVLAVISFSAFFQPIECLQECVKPDPSAAPGSVFRKLTLEITCLGNSPKGGSTDVIQKGVTSITAFCDFHHRFREESRVSKSIAELWAQIAPGKMAQGTQTCSRISNTS